MIVVFDIFCILPHIELFEIAFSTAYCESGGIGRRAGFRCQWGNP